MVAPPLSHFLIVALGGAVGAAGRFGTALWVNELVARSRFPWGTLSVNVIGSVLIGVAVMLTVEHAPMSRTRLLLIVGILGGFTTFSAFSLELFEMLGERRFQPAAAYAAGSVLLCVMGTFAGAFLTRAVLR